MVNRWRWLNAVFCLVMSGVAYAATPLADASVPACQVTPGDITGDTFLNVVDVVNMVNVALSDDPPILACEACLMTAYPPAFLLGASDGCGDDALFDGSSGQCVSDVSVVPNCLVPFSCDSVVLPATEGIDGCSRLLGDVDGSGALNVVDMVQMVAAILGQGTLQPYFLSPSVCALCHEEVTAFAYEAGEFLGSVSAMAPACLVDEYVSFGACQACPPGTSHPAGAIPDDGDTACVPVLCEQGFYVSDHVCTPCVPNTINASGDDASGADTVCDTVFCGNGITEGVEGEMCDDGNTVLEVCPYGVTSCIVCDPQCVRVAGETSFCGDGKIDVVAGETCDDGNAETEACSEGLDGCAVCDANCQEIPGSD